MVEGLGRKYLILGSPNYSKCHGIQLTRQLGKESVASDLPLKSDHVIVENRHSPLARIRRPAPNGQVTLTWAS